MNIQPVILELADGQSLAVRPEPALPATIAVAIQGGGMYGSGQVALRRHEALALITALKFGVGILTDMAEERREQSNPGTEASSPLTHQQAETGHR